MIHYHQYITTVWLLKGLGCQCSFHDAADNRPNCSLLHTA